MPELPAARRARLIEAWGIKDDDARVLVDVPGLADYAERAVAALKAGTAKDVANWVRQDVLAYLNDRGLAPAVLAPEMLAELVGLVAGGTISRGRPRTCSPSRWPRTSGRATIVEDRGLAQVSDAGELGAVVDRVLAGNAATVERVPRRRRRQGPEEEAQRPHGPGDEGAEGQGQRPGVNAPRPRLRRARRRQPCTRRSSVIRHRVSSAAGPENTLAEPRR